MSIQSIDERLANYRSRFAAGPHARLLRFWDRLDSSQRSLLLDDLDAVDFDLVDRLVPVHVVQSAPAHAVGELSPPKTFPADPDINLVGRYADAVKQGVSFIRTDKVAALTVAGGQGTRLGFPGPKGAFAISPLRDKTLFQLFAEAIAATQARYGGRVPWYIMTSPANHESTHGFFDERDYFGLDREDIIFFQQGVMPAFAPSGEVLLGEPHRLALSPDGHGGTLRALATSGALGDMKACGIEFVSYFQVDNPLVRPIDPLFIGLTRLEMAEMACKVISKAHDFEKVGVVACCDGRTQVIEYSDLPEALAAARDENGRRLYDAGNMAVHVFRRSFLERLTDNVDNLALPWHRAEKKVPYVDQEGNVIEPAEPNAVKLETFIFDALPLAEKSLLLETKRTEEFSPVKNATGNDSAATSRRDLIRRAAAWLDNSGVNVPRRDDGEPDAVIEISPLLALDASHLRERLIERPDIQPGATIYLEP